MCNGLRHVIEWWKTARAGRRPPAAAAAAAAPPPPQHAWTLPRSVQPHLHEIVVSSPQAEARDGPARGASLGLQPAAAAGPQLALLQVQSRRIMPTRSTGRPPLGPGHGCRRRRLHRTLLQHGAPSTQGDLRQQAGMAAMRSTSALSTGLYRTRQGGAGAGAGGSSSGRRGGRGEQRQRSGGGGAHSSLRAPPFLQGGTSVFVDINSPGSGLPPRGVGRLPGCPTLCLGCPPASPCFSASARTATFPSLPWGATRRRAGTGR